MKMVLEVEKTKALDLAKELEKRTEVKSISFKYKTKSLLG